MLFAVSALFGCGADIIVRDDDGGGAGNDLGVGGQTAEPVPQNGQEYCDAVLAKGCDDNGRCPCEGDCGWDDDYPCKAEGKRVLACHLEQIHAGNCVSVCPEEIYALAACEDAHAD
ncbi:MAG: hypothetical protein HOW73_01645 [Polyangiaceae bacterium]|nr:hypothetical protein [Polyangiaceae bacterium]